MLSSRLKSLENELRNANCFTKPVGDSPTFPRCIGKFPTGPLVVYQEAYWSAAGDSQITKALGET